MHNIKVFWEACPSEALAGGVINMLNKIKSGFDGKSKVTIALAAVALLGAVGYAMTIAVVRADETSSHPIIQVLAERFGLNEEEVKEVFDEVHANHFAQKQTMWEEGLNEAVADGVITEEQKQALLDKKADMKTHKEEYKQEMQAWFEKEGIDSEALMQYGGFGKRGFHKWGMGKTYTK